MSVKLILSDLFKELKTVTYANIYDYFRKKHKHNMYVKKIEDSENLLLIHNNLDKMNNSDLYHECRSIVIDVTDCNTPQIITYSHDNVLYTTLDSYQQAPNDIIEESFEGTMVGVFHYNGKWYFNSTRCPSIDDSYFFNKNKSHGKMLDEVLAEMFPESNDVRESFVSHLDKNKYYYFIILHHENNYIVDYTWRFGENYKKLVHIITRDKVTHLEETISRLDLPLVYSERVHQIQEARDWLDAQPTEPTNCVQKEGVIIKRYDEAACKNVLIKIPSKAYAFVRQEKPNYSNVWVGCIEIFQHNNTKYRCEDYLRKYYPDKQITSERKYDITGMLYYIIKTLALELSILYDYFTEYNTLTHRYEKKNNEQFTQLFLGNQFKTFKNQIQRLQHYQYNYKKSTLKYVDFIEHIRVHTSPVDIYNMMKEHHTFAKTPNDIYRIITSKANDLKQMNEYVSLYLQAI